MQPVPLKAEAEAPALIAGRAVLSTESDALQALAGSLDHRFVAAAEGMTACQGRVVVTGMGKSGHIARKIAATLASTGTPALFVHPGEASHGDLGMIEAQDLVIALSNSGETAELSDIIAYTKRFSIPLIGITRNADSSLGKASDILLQLPDVPEACSIGMAPTTSTTMMLALGDALAVAVLGAKGFTAENFGVFHPGGKLGQRLLRVEALMHGGDELPLVPAETPMSEALLTMTEKRFGVIGVTAADGSLAGIVTDGDLRRHMGSNLLAATAGEVMTAGGLTITPEALAAEALAIMNARSVTTLFVVTGGKPVGIVHIHDLLRAGIA